MVARAQNLYTEFSVRLVPSRYLRVLWGEKIGYEDGLRRAGYHGNINLQVKTLLILRGTGTRGRSGTLL